MNVVADTLSRVHESASKSTSHPSEDATLNMMEEIFTLEVLHGQEDGDTLPTDSLSGTDTAVDTALNVHETDEDLTEVPSQQLPKLTLFKKPTNESTEPQLTNATSSNTQPEGQLESECKLNASPTLTSSARKLAGNKVKSKVFTDIYFQQQQDGVHNTLSRPVSNDPVRAVHPVLRT